MNKPIKHTKKRKPTRKLNKTRRNKGNMKPKKSIVANEIYKLPVGISGGGMLGRFFNNRVAASGDVPISQEADSEQIDVSMQELDNSSVEEPEVGESFFTEVREIENDYAKIFQSGGELTQKLTELTKNIQWKEMLESHYSDIISMDKIPVNAIFNSEFFKISDKFITDPNLIKNINDSVPSRKKRKDDMSIDSNNDSSNKTKKLDIYVERMKYYIDNYLRLIQETANKKNLLIYTKEFLEQIGLTYNKFKEKLEKNLKKLKKRINLYFSKTTTTDAEKKLYTIIVNDKSDDINNDLTIDLTYTKLGYAIMLFTEIKHDFKQLDSTYKDNIKNQIKSQLTKETELIEILDILAGDQQLTSELCLYISSKLNIPRIVQKEGEIKIQLGNNIAGMGIYPFNGLNTTIYTSDADYSAPYLVSQQRSQTTITTNSQNQLLKLDGGPKPTLTGTKEGQERLAQLLVYNNQGKDTTTPASKIKPLKLMLNIYRPDKTPTIKITKDYADTEFTFYAYGTDSQYKFPSKTITQSLIRSELDKLRKPNRKKKNLDAILLSTNLIKSVGDMVPYIVTCCQLSLEPAYIGFKNLCASIDYSMMFQVLSNMVYNKNANLSNLQDQEVIVGCQIQTQTTGTSNLFFPFTDKEKRIYRILYKMAELDKESEAWNAITGLNKELDKILQCLPFEYQVNNTILGDGGCNITELLDNSNFKVPTENRDQYNKFKTKYQIFKTKLNNISNFISEIKKIAENEKLSINNEREEDLYEQPITKSQLCISNIIYNMIYTSENLGNPPIGKVVHYQEEKPSKKQKIGEHNVTQDIPLLSSSTSTPNVNTSIPECTIM
jgi:thiaminase